MLLDLWCPSNGSVRQTGHLTAVPTCKPVLLDVWGAKAQGLAARHGKIRSASVFSTWTDIPPPQCLPTSPGGENKKRKPVQYIATEGKRPLQLRKFHENVENVHHS